MSVQLVSHPMAPPDPGTAELLKPGLLWLRMPLPFSLDHINLWLIQDENGWVAVDTGLGTDESEGIWHRVIEDSLNDFPIHRLLVTHMHPDHIGCAGLLCDRFGLDLEMTQTEYLMCRNLVNDPFQQPPPEAIRFYKAAGWDDAALKEYAGRFGGFGRAVRNLPNGYRRLNAGDKVGIDGGEWEVLIGRGHSPEHACFLNTDSNLFISGDQLLPSISSNVSVWPTEPYGNPLADWLASCKHLIERLPEDVLILPSHGLPFVGAHPRLKSLITGHEKALDRLLDAAERPRRVVDLVKVLFRRELSGESWLMATGECIAHLNYLVEAGELQRQRDEHGIDQYQRA